MKIVKRFNLLVPMNNAGSILENLGRVMLTIEWMMNTPMFQNPPPLLDL